MDTETGARRMLLYNSLRGLHLLEKADKITVLEDLLGIQSQFSGYAQLSLRLRASDYTEADWQKGIVKIWSHRGTMHLVPETKLTLHLAAAGYDRAFTDGAWSIPKEAAERWAPFIMDEVRGGNTSREGLKQACRAAGMPAAVLERAFYGWGGLIYEMTYRGMLAGVPGNRKEYLLPRTEAPWPGREEAREEMLRTYFRHFGPATRADCRYFFGRWRSAEIDPLLDRVLPALTETVIGGKKYYSADAPVPDGVIPDCVLVPGFDQLVLGYRDRSRMIDEKHLRKLTNISGIVAPSVIVRERMRAKWRFEDGTVTVVPFEKLLKKDEAAIGRRVRAAFGRKTEVRFEPVMPG